jgi:hypothetical protein
MPPSLSCRNHPGQALLGEPAVAPKRWLVWVLPVLVMLGGCQEYPPITSWESPRLVKIEKEWRAVWDAFHSAPPGTYGRKNEKLQDLLRDVFARHLSGQDLRHLLAACDSLPVRAKDRSDFVNAVLKYMTETYIETGDRKSLVMLLATRFADNLYFESPVEYVVACGIGKRSVDPILVFGEAYSKCKDEAARHHLAVIVRRAFLGSGIGGESDADFVKNAMRWYEREKGHLAPRYLYGPATVSYDEYPQWYDDKKDPLNVWDHCKVNPLFVDESSPRVLGE